MIPKASENKKKKKKKIESLLPRIRFFETLGIGGCKTNQRTFCSFPSALDKLLASKEPAIIWELVYRKCGCVREIMKERKKEIER